MSRRGFLSLLLVAGAALAVSLIGVIAFLAWQNHRRTDLLRDGIAAYSQGDFAEAVAVLSRYVAYDKGNEDAWKGLASAFESSGNWPAAAAAWKQLSNLNVLEDDYQRRYIEASYRSHNYEALDKALSALPPARRENYLSIDALTQFKVKPNLPETTALVQELAPDSEMSRLIQCLQSSRPRAELAAELEHLEELEEPVIRVEAYMLDAFLCENELHDFDQTERLLRRAAEITPFLCRMELGDFFFRHGRYSEAAEEYQATSPATITDESLLNYAEALFYAKDDAGLAELDKQVPRERLRGVLIRAYIQSLLALLQKDTAKMLQNYKVAQFRRTTPMGMLLNYAVGVSRADVALLTFVLERWCKSKEFRERLPECLQEVRTVIVWNMERGKWHEAANLAAFFLDLQPPDAVVLQAVLTNQLRSHAVSRPLLRQALELYPRERAFAQLRLQAALEEEDTTEVLAAHDQLIALGQDEAVRYGKALYLERQGQTEAAFQELLELRAEDPSLASAKHLLSFGMRTGHPEALELAAQVPELAALARFEQMRRREDGLEDARRMLAEQPLEQGLSVERPEDREILLSLVFCLGGAREYSRAIAVYEQLLPYCQDNAAFPLNLSELYAAIDNHPMALKYAADAYRRFPDNPMVRAIYGVRCAEGEDFAKAAELIPETVPDPKVREILVVCLEKTLQDRFERGRMPECQETLRRLQALSPENPYAQEISQKLQANRKGADNGD